MEDVIGPKIIRIRPTRDANDRQILTVRACNRIYHTQASHRESDRTCPDTMGPSIPVRRIPGVQFIATSDQIQPRFCQQMVQQHQIEVPWNREHIVHSNLHKPCG
jgi:hypothetical protein